MLILNATTDNIQVVLSGAVTTNQLPCMASWRDITTTTFTPGRTVTNTNSTTDVNLVPAPGASTQRVCDWLSIWNRDTAAATVTIKFDANGTEYILWQGSLAIGERVEYQEGHGFSVFNSVGALKTAQAAGAGVSNALNVVVLASNVVNNNAVANTIADVTGLSFAVTAGETYWFEFAIPYTSAAATTGSRWSINGPAAPTMLNYTSEYTLAATTKTLNNATAYDIPAASNATSLTAGNVATVWGIIKPSSDGTVIARFASEVAGSAITAKAGATLRWMRVL